MNGRRIGEKRVREDNGVGAGMEPQQKKQCQSVEVGGKPKGSVSAKMVPQEFQELMTMAKTDCVVFERKIKQMTQFKETLKNKQKKERVLKDISFMRALQVVFVELLKNPFFNNDIDFRKYVSILCCDLILTIHKECTVILQEIRLVEGAEEAFGFNVGSERLLIKDGEDPDREAFCDYFKVNLIILKEYQDKYLPYVILDYDQCFVLGEIALFWGETKMALDLFKKGKDFLDEKDPQYEIILRKVLLILNNYKILFPDNFWELDEYYNSIKKICLPMISRTTSCYNWEELERGFRKGNSL